MIVTPSIDEVFPNVNTPSLVTSPLSKMLEGVIPAATVAIASSTSTTVTVNVVVTVETSSLYWTTAVNVCSPIANTEVVVIAGVGVAASRS